MRLMVCAGASGGGVYPALAVLQALGNEAEEILWMGSEGGMEAELVTRAGIPFTAIPAAGLHGIGLGSLPGNVWKLVKGFFAAKQIIRKFRPEAMFFTGGYVAIPAGLAGRKIPTVVYVPDIEPGLALKVVSRFADRIAVTAETSKQYFRRKTGVSVSGYPTRQELQLVDKPSALKAFDFSPDMPVLLVFGGSKGSVSINRALIEILPALLTGMQIIHISGEYGWLEVKSTQESIANEHAKRYRAYPYLHEEMGAALSAADLVVSRAGASALGEFPLLGLPAVLIPYPAGWHLQNINAEYLAERGAAVILKDEHLSSELLPTIQRLMQTDSELSEMKTAMKYMAQPNAAEVIADLLRSVVRGHN